MQSILHQIFDGNLDDVLYARPDSEEYRQCMDIFRTHCDELREKLRNMEPGLDRAYLRSTEELTAALSIETEETFCQGFRLGALLMLEILRAD